VKTLGPQSGERNAGFLGVSEATRNNIIAKGGPDIGFNPKGDLDHRRKALMLLPADPATTPDPTTAAGKSIPAERNAQKRAYPIPIDDPDSPRYKFRTLRLNPVNAQLNDVQFDKEYGLVQGTSVKILGPQSGERNAGTQGVSEKIRNSILDKGGPDIGINPKSYMDLRRKNLLLILEPAAAPDPRTVAEAADKTPGIDYRLAYPVPIGGPGSPRHEFRALRQNDENALLKDTGFEKKYSLPSKITGNILGPKSGERDAGTHGVSEEVRKRILDNGGPDIGFNPRGSLDRRRKALIAAAAAEVPRAEAAGEGPAKRPRLDTGLHNEPSMSDLFMQYPDVPLLPINPAENPDTRLVSPPSPDSRALPPFGERPGSGDRPAAAPQGGGHRSPSPDPEQDSIDAILQSFKDY
jgi:hypothetical protein